MAKAREIAVREMVTGEMTKGMTATYEAAVYEAAAYETTTYDIRAENGHRLLTCVKSGSNISLQGKDGNIELNSFLEQVFNPLKARMKKTG